MDLKTIIQATVTTTIKTLMKAILKDLKTEIINYYDELNKKPINNPYKETEKLLYSYKYLKLHIESWPLDEKDMQKEGIKHKSKDIIVFSTGGGEREEPDQLLENMIARKRASIERTKKIVEDIDAAVDKLSAEQKTVIELWYFQEMSMDDIINILKVGQSTIYRLKTPAVKKICSILFGG